MGAGRLCARFTAFTFLGASWLCALLSTLGQPTTNKFEFVTSTFYTPGAYAENRTVELQMKLGMFGYCLYYPNGTNYCPHSALGFKIDNSLLPPETNADPYEPLNQVMNYKLNGALLLVPLQVGQTGLTILSTLVPSRFFSLLALIQGGLALGLAGLNLLISLICFVGASNRIEQFWTGVALATLSVGQWLLIASIFSIVVAIPFLWAMVPPPRKKVQASYNMSWKT